MRVEPATIDHLVAIRGEQRAFWGERDLAAIHHPLLVHDFGETAFVVPGPEGEVLAYLFGLLTPQGVAYSHLVAVREGHRRRGLARRLYEELESVARSRGARAIKAFTRPTNATSIAFHTALGFTATDVPGYVGPGETRTVFWKPLEEGGPVVAEFERALPGGAIMRPVRLEDADAVHDTIESEREHLSRHLRWTVRQTREGTRAFVARAVADRVSGEGLHAAILATDGRVLGMTGFVRLSLEDRAAEIGYWLAEAAQGSGTMTAAVSELVREAFGPFALNRLEIRATVENVRSRAVAQRLGFREEGILRQAHRVGGRMHDDVVYGLLASDRPPEAPAPGREPG